MPTMARAVTGDPATTLVSGKRIPPELIREDGTIDWSPWHLTEEEDVGQSGEQFKIIAMLLSSIEELAIERRWESVLVANDQFFAWVKHEGQVQISPDVYMVDDPPPIDEALPGRWETWRPEHNPPRFAVEIVSEGNWKKDYAIHRRYDHLGTSELVIVDVEAYLTAHPRRFPLQVYRRRSADPADEFERVYHGDGPVYCTQLDAYLCLVRVSEGRVRVRVSRDPEGHSLIPTTRERVAEVERGMNAANRRADAAERGMNAANRRADAVEREARAAEQRADAAEAELAALRERLRALDSEQH